MLLVSVVLLGSSEAFLLLGTTFSIDRYVDVEIGNIYRYVNIFIIFKGNSVFGPLKITLNAVHFQDAI